MPQNRGKAAIRRVPTVQISLPPPSSPQFSDLSDNRSKSARLRAIWDLGMDPESGCGRPNRGNTARPIRHRPDWSHARQAYIPYGLRSRCSVLRPRPYSLQRGLQPEFCFPRANDRRSDATPPASQVRHAARAADGPRARPERRTLPQTCRVDGGAGHFSWMR
jgi:hypothetical protein